MKPPGSGGGDDGGGIMKERRVTTETDPIRVAFDLDHGDGLAVGGE